MSSSDECLRSWRMEADQRLIRGIRGEAASFCFDEFFLLKSFEVSPHIRGKLPCGAGVVKNNNTAKCKIHRISRLFKTFTAFTTDHTTGTSKDLSCCQADLRSLPRRSTRRELTASTTTFSRSKEKSQDEHQGRGGLRRGCSECFQPI